jgi:hypothetical protein
MSVLILVLAAVVALAIAWFAYQAKKKRREALFLFAAQHDLEYSRPDPYSIDESYGFALFRRGDGRGCENVLAGVWRGLPVREADYWYYEETSDGRGGRTRSYSYFSVVVADLSCSVPHISIERENLLTRLTDHLGFHDIDFESEAFNRTFRVRSDDRQFAYQLIDARMMQWLLATGGEFGFELLGPNLLAYSKRRGPADLPPLFEAAVGFADQLPRLIHSEYDFRSSPAPKPDTIEESPGSPERSSS